MVVNGVWVFITSCSARMAEQEVQRQIEKAQLAEARCLIELHEERLRRQQVPPAASAQGAAHRQSRKKPRRASPKKWSDLGPRQLERRGKGIQGKVQTSCRLNWARTWKFERFSLSPRAQGSPKVILTRLPQHSQVTSVQMQRIQRVACCQGCWKAF